MRGCLSGLCFVIPAFLTSLLIAPRLTYSAVHQPLGWATRSPPDLGCRERSEVGGAGGREVLTEAKAWNCLMGGGNRP